MKKLNSIFYDNKWKKSDSRKFFRRNSLLQKKKTFVYPECNSIDINNIIISAQSGLKNNRNFKFFDRQKYIYKIYKSIRLNYKLIAKLEASETGKNLIDAENEILHSAKIWLYAAKYLKDLSYTKKLSKNYTSFVRFEPVGIVSLIVPWNFPFVVVSERLPFILAAGNSVILKPSEYASQSLIYLMRIIKKINLPSGVVNLVTGSGKKVGSYLTKNKKINMVSFTGSTQVGKTIMNNASKSIKRLSLELGGKNSFIVLKDANIEKTVKIIIDSFTGNAGQSCVSTSRLLIDLSIKKELIKSLLNKLKTYRDFRKLYGFISTEKQIKSIKKILKKNNKFNKNIIFGSPNFKSINFCNPIIYDNLPEQNIINKKEIFGPILSINSFGTIKEAIKIANSTEYGLSAVVCGKNKKNIMKITEQLNTGRIWINESVKVNFPSLPIGGYKESGLNRESGTEGLKTYSEIKSIILRN